MHKLETLSYVRPALLLMGAYKEVEGDFLQEDGVTGQGQWVPTAREQGIDRILGRNS